MANATFGEYLGAKRIKNLYPTEFVIRTLLGNYPRVKLDKSTYAGSAILDMGFGDGRNFPLLHDIDMRIHGVEIDDKLIEQARQRFQDIPLTLKQGHNTAIPFDDNMFDYVLACHSCYYVKDGETFDDNLQEIARVLKPGGTLIFSLPKTSNFIVKGAIEQDDHHFIVQNDPYNLRNGTVLRAFATEEEIEQAFSPYFEQFGLGSCDDDFYGLEQYAWIGVARRRDIADHG